jgi:carboxyl-terminal processing protease
MKISVLPRLFNLTAHVIAMAALFAAVSGQGFDSLERGRMKDMLKIVKNEVKANYYDPNYHGIDLDARFKQADERLNQVKSTQEALGVIAQVLLDFNDSHLFFIPPPTTREVEYGWRMQAIGNKVFITQVKPGSDADKKGLKRGDQIITLNGFTPARSDIWKMLYYYNGLNKRDVMSLSVLSPGADAPHALDAKSDVTKSGRVVTLQDTYQIVGYSDPENSKHRFVTLGDIAIWRMPSFNFEPDQVDSFVNQIRGASSVVLDLRGNSGGYVKTLERMVSNFFENDVNISEVKGRKKMDPSTAKGRGKNAYAGKLIVLIDSESGSAAEMFARVVQLQGRGKVLGDVSAGAVMQSRTYNEQMGDQSVIPFGVHVTIADVIMSDGKSLEHVGVIPDELILPTGADMTAGRDPVLARAVELLGGKISPEDAGKFFKYYWNRSVERY